MSSSANEFPEMGSPDMNSEKLEERLRLSAAVFPYPETPDLAVRERQRWVNLARPVPTRKRGRLAIGLALAFIALAVALLVSPARARVLDWIRIGSVRIFFTQPTPTATVLLPSGTPSPVMTWTPGITPTPLNSVLNLSGQTDLTRAQEQAGFTIQMPTYPADLGLPDHVFLQRLSGPVVILVWMDDRRPEQVYMSLSQSNSDQVSFEKYQPKTVQDTRVGDHAAVWVDGEYIVVMRNGDANFTRLVNQSHTLIWDTGEKTFRLETDADLETAIRIAESIQ